MAINSSSTPQVALITGAARRIGADIARTLHAAKLNIIVHYRSAQGAATQLVQELNQIRPDSAIAVAANLNDDHEVASLVHKAQTQWGRLDVLVNNASGFYKTPFGQVSSEQWQDLMTVNLKAPFFLAQAAAKFLQASNGNIVNITDIHGQKPMADYSTYCISKSGLLMLTKVLAKELAPHVRVNAVSPGAILWPEGENTLTNAEQAHIIAKTPLARAGNSANIAKAVLFFIRDAEFVTGQVLNVDGGRMLAW